MSDEATGRTLEQLGEQIDLEVEHVPIASIDLDEQNPNEMDDATMDALREEVRRGFLQPIVVRRVGDRYGMVDGEHRMLVVREQGYETIPAVVIDADEDEGRIRLLTMNRLRGQMVPIRMAYLLADLATRVGEAELRSRLGMDASEYKDTLRLANFTDDLGEKVKEQVERDAREAPLTLTFVCNQRDAKTVQKAVEAMKDGKLDNGPALAKICREWTKSQTASG